MISKSTLLNVVGYLVSLFAIFLAGCAGSLDIASRLDAIDPVVFRYDYHPNLPYKELVLEVRDAAEIEKLRSARLSSFEIAFDQVSYAVFDYAADRFELSRDEKSRLFSELEDQSSRVAQVFFNDFVVLHESEDYGQSQEVFTYKTYGAVRSFGRVLSKRMCSLAAILIPLIIPNPETGAAAVVLNRPCEIILAEALNPILEEMENQALLEDHIVCRLNITNHVRQMVLELSTVEDDFKADFQTLYSRKIIFDLFTSKADLSAQFVAEIKAGFDLKRYFAVDIDEMQKTMIVTLPEAEILSVDLRPTITHMEDGWFIEIEEAEINQAMEIARERLIATAVNSGILNKARENARVVVDRILAPLASTPAFRYKVQVRFADEIGIPTSRPNN